MNHDIVIVRDGNDYRLMHGYLRLANLLRTDHQVEVGIPGEGTIRIMKSRIGYIVGKDGYHLPLFMH